MGEDIDEIIAAIIIGIISYALGGFLLMIGMGVLSSIWPNLPTASYWQALVLWVLIALIAGVITRRM